MKFNLPPLPFDKHDLPHISSETIDYHYGKHHQAYINNLNGLLENTPSKETTLEGIIRTTSGALFNNAAQVWNHSFYWHCMHSKQNETPDDALLELIKQSFGSFDQFKTQFITAGKTLFGSGWVWLTKNQHHNLCIRSTTNAATPLTDHETPLLVCDVWEHAYYIDTRNDRATYLEHFWSMINWSFVSDQLHSPYQFPTNAS